MYGSLYDSAVAVPSASRTSYAFAFLFFLNDTAPTEIYTLSLHDALPISVTRVLVVDDEPQILRALRINLRVRDYEVHVASTGAEALEVAGRYPPDLVILDLGLPDLDGVEVIQGLRGWTKAPIIVLSGRADSVDKVEALDAGADDYVTKPFGVEELMARMRAAVRRTGTPEDLPRIRLGEPGVDVAAQPILRQ